MLSRRTLRTQGIVVPTYWWDGHPNFGDDLTPWLLPRLGVAPIHREPEHAQLIGVGSILEFLPPNWEGAIWGSGLMSDHGYSLPRAHVLAVRGHLTADRIGASEGCALGDPGILVARYLRAPRKRWDVALVPHGHHRQHRQFLHLARTSDHSVHVVNVHQPAPRAIREIGQARVVVTTSLHGLITADSYGIPAVWTTLEPALGGGSFKFRDYESVITPGRSRFVPFKEGMPLPEFLSAAWAAQRNTVMASGDALVDALKQLADVVEVRSFPRGVIDVLRNG